MTKGCVRIMADKQLNMRISDETRAMFDELVKSSGMTQAEYFASLLQGAKTEEIKALVPDSAEEIDECVEKAYTAAKFGGDDPAPMAYTKLNGSPLNILELWHGPTCAFKDMALQILPHLLRDVPLSLSFSGQYQGPGT